MITDPTKNLINQLLKSMVEVNKDKLKGFEGEGEYGIWYNGIRLDLKMEKGYHTEDEWIERISKCCICKKTTDDKSYTIGKSFEEDKHYCKEHKLK